MARERQDAFLLRKEKKHGEIGFYLTQAMTSHGCFNEYLKRFNIKDEEACDYCGSPVDDAEHTLFACDKWSVAREAREVVCLFED